MSATRAAYLSFRDIMTHPDKGHFGESDRNHLYDYLFALYSNTAYTDPLYAPYLNKFKLYTATRLLYNPTRRLVDFYANQVYSGVLYSTPQSNVSLPDAIPFNPTISPELRDAIAQIWTWSNFASLKNRIVRLGAMTGNVLAVVYDDPVSSKIQIAPVWPGFVTDLQLNRVGDVQAYAIEYRVVERNNGMQISYTYRKEVNKYEIRTFKDGAPFGYDDMPPVFPNPYQFVPAAWIKHQDTGTDYGNPSIAGSINRIDELNSLVAHLFDHFHRQIDLPQVIATDGPISAALKAPTDDETGFEARQAVRLLKTTAGASVLPLVGNVNPKAVAEQMDKLLGEIEHEHPELTFWSQLRAMSQVTGPGASRLMGDVQGRVWEAAANYDVQFKKLFQMAVAIGGFRFNYGGWKLYDVTRQRFAPFDLGSYAAGDLEFDILPRPLIPTNQNEHLEERGKRINQAMQLREYLPSTEILNQAGYDEEQQRELMAQRAAEAAQNGEEDEAEDEAEDDVTSED